MAVLVSTHGQGHAGHDMSPTTALKYAWRIWMTMLALPAVLFIFVIWHAGQERGPVDLSHPIGWFIAAVAYMVLLVPFAFFLRSRYFKNYWRGERVAPRDYLIGMTVLWVALEIGGILSLVGCLVTRSLLPCMFPALVAFGMFAIHWPNGRAMVAAGRGATDDPETYEEPR